MEPRPLLTIADARLQNLFVHRPEMCATVDEYAQATGISVDGILELLSPWLEDGSLSLEIVGDDMFVHTGPLGRPTPSHLADVPANLWERLRSRHNAEDARTLWQMVRSMERAGWTIETNPSRLAFGLGRNIEPPTFGVVVGHNLVGVITFVNAQTLAERSGPLTSYDLAGAAAVAVAVPEGQLDTYITGVRVWVMTRQLPAAISVLLLEAPRWNPTILTPADNSVVPVSLTREALTSTGIPDRA